MKPTISLVIPMFNEEANIDHAIAYAVDALQQHSRDYEIIIVDDASTDESPEIVRRATEGNPKIRLIRHDFNLKLGASLRTGLAAAKNELILYMDADLPFDPDVLGRAIRAMNVTRADVISGYRFDRTTEGFKRTVYTIIYNWMIRVLFHIYIRDINFSFKLMKREVLQAIQLRSEGSLIDAELIVKARNHGFFIQQIGLDYFPRVLGTSHLASNAVILKIFRELITMFPEMRRRSQRPLPAGEGLTAQ
jgi:glycosyltransferase involved in cell wall biosynthesis